MKGVMSLGIALALAGCAVPAVRVASAPTVTAVAETEPVGTANADAADDPAIWHNPADPHASLIVATDKKGGLYVYDLTGRKRSFTPAGHVNNVDLVDLGPGRVLVLASDRNDLARAQIRAFLLDPASGELTAAGALEGGVGEAYGVCARRDGDGVRIASILKSGAVVEQRASLQGRQLSLVESLPARMVPTQAEGCVYDPRNGGLYVAEEDAGIWRFPPLGAGALVAPVDNRLLFADAEGLAIAPLGTTGGFLVVSSQGDNAYALYRLPDMAFAGRFRIAAGTFGATEETDGIELSTASFGPSYHDGLFVAQDGNNAPYAQNFKLVSWADVLHALGLDRR